MEPLLLFTLTLSTTFPHSVYYLKIRFKVIHIGNFAVVFFNLEVGKKKKLIVLLHVNEDTATRAF